jgi:N utilization substance protein B
MPSPRQIREAVVQFLYCADLEGGADPAALREPFWDFVSESDLRKLLIATFRAVHHLASGREERLIEFQKRADAAMPLLAANPATEKLPPVLKRISRLESDWSQAFDLLEHLPKDDDDASVASKFAPALQKLFRIDRDLAAARADFIDEAGLLPALRGTLEPVTASIRRLQRISDRMRMVEEPEKFPEQGDLAKLRDSKSELASLRQTTNSWVDAILNHKDSIDGKLGAVIENYAPARIDPVDRAILRLATHELLHTSTPPKVVINEAIELAKRFGTTDSKRFVNGILDKIAGLTSVTAADGAA